VWDLNLHEIEIKIVKKNKTQRLAEDFNTDQPALF
jgi:hypothetical protein